MKENDVRRRSISPQADDTPVHWIPKVVDTKLYFRRTYHDGEVGYIQCHEVILLC